MSQEGHWYVAFEVLSPGDESIDFEEFSDIRNSDGTGPGRAFRPPKSKSLQSFKVCIPSTSMSAVAAAAHDVVVSRIVWSGDAWSHRQTTLERIKSNERAVPSRKPDQQK